MTNEKQKPNIKCKEGIWQIAVWIKKENIPAKDDYDVEQTVTKRFCCLSGGILRDNKWQNIKIWFRLSQFGNLKKVVDEAAEEIKNLNPTNNESIDVDELCEELETKEALK